jgi:hypothetical protein
MSFASGNIRARASARTDGLTASFPERARYSGRGAPLVRKAAPTPSSPTTNGFLESLPFLVFGAVCLLIGVWLYVANPVPGNPLPLWILLVGMGLISVAGGVLGALVAPEAPRTPVSRWRMVLPSTPLAVPPAPVERDLPPARASRPVSSAASRVAPRPTRVYDDEEDDAVEEPPRVPRAPVGVRGARLSAPPRATTPEADDEPPARAPPRGDDVTRDLEDLETVVRGTRRANASSAPPPANVEDTIGERVCHGCDRKLAPGVRSGECQSCGRTLCADCQASANHDGHPGLCPICGLLDQAAPNRSRA